MDPNPSLLADAPLEVLEARTLFRSPSIRRRGAASLRRLGSGRLLMTFLIGTGPGHVNDGAVMLTHSDDDGATWDEPFPIYAVPGWDSLPLGGIAHVRDDLLHLVVGRVKFDASLGGVRSYLERTFNDRIFVIAFLSNAALAILLVWVGDQLAVDLATAVVVVLGVRIFQNLAAIRRRVFGG